MAFAIVPDVIRPDMATFPVAVNFPAVEIASASVAPPLIVKWIPFAVVVPSTSSPFDAVKYVALGKLSEPEPVNPELFMPKLP